MHRHPAPCGPARPALLFVHGGYVDSRCWTYQFIPFFQRVGHDCYALDLSGHGASEGRERIDEFGIDDFADDVAAALRGVGRPAVLVGHSMGALVIERYLEAGDAHGAVLLAPVPPTGTAGSALRLALRHPGFFAALEDALRGRLTPQAAQMMTQVYFSPAMSPRDTLKFLPLLAPESRRAVAEMALLQTRPPRRRARLPVLVIGGEQDAVFPASLLHFSACAWRADVLRIPDAGHMLMLDPQWERVARHVADWIGATRQARSAAQ